MKFLLRLVRIGLFCGLAVAGYGIVGGCAGTHSDQVRTTFEQSMEGKVELGERRRQVLAISSARESRQLAPIYFDYGQYRIREDQAPTLYENAEKIMTSPVFELIIEGHCDLRGSDKFNVALGQRRADSTRDFLVRAGVSSAQLTTISFGSDRPFARGHKEAAWVKNRRVEFVRVEDLAF